MNIPQEYFLDGADDFWTISLFWPVKIGVNMFNWVKWSENQISSLREKFEKFFIVKTKLSVESLMMKHFRIISYKCHRYQMLREKNSKKYIHRHWLRYRLKKRSRKIFRWIEYRFLKFLWIFKSMFQCFLHALNGHSILISPRFYCLLQWFCHSLCVFKPRKKCVSLLWNRIEGKRSN